MYTVIVSFGVIVSFWFSIFIAKVIFGLYATFLVSGVGFYSLGNCCTHTSDTIVQHTSVNYGHTRQSPFFTLLFFRLNLFQGFSLNFGEL